MHGSKTAGVRDLCRLQPVSAIVLLRASGSPPRPVPEAKQIRQAESVNKTKNMVPHLLEKVCSFLFCFVCLNSSRTSMRTGISSSNSAYLSSGRESVSYVLSRRSSAAAAA